jgi:hypothetical protein
MGGPAFYQQDQTLIDSTIERLKKVEQDINLAYQRWEEFEKK